MIIRWVLGLLLISLTGMFLALSIFSFGWNKRFTLTFDADNLDFLSVKNDEESCYLFFEFGGRVYRERNNSNISIIDGQKAVCLDAGVAPQSGVCVVYSFGSSNEWSFDSTMDSYGCDVFVFDPSENHLLSKSKTSNNTKRVHYFNFGLGGYNKQNSSQGKRRRAFTLKSIRKYLMHSFRPIDYLSIDIEGEEWFVLDYLLQNKQSLQDVKQIGMEIHFDTDDQVERYNNLLRRFESSGFVRFFFRQNRFMTNTFQIAWLNGNYSRTRYHPASDEKWFNELMLNNKLPPIVPYR